MIYIALAFLGVALGSFINALVWRLRQQDVLLQKKKKPTKQQLSELSVSTGRSMCPHCRHTLAWYDLIPVVSWATLRGRCRYCTAKISVQYPLVELLVACLLPLSWYGWPLELSNVATVAVFAIWIGIIVLFVALMLYDLKWMELPNRLIYPLYLAVGVFIVIQLVSGSNVADLILSSLLGMAVLGGLFWLLYQLSGGTWIGGGDVRLGFALGALLGWQLSLLTLTLAAYLGTAVIIVLVLFKKYKRNLRLPFGPFLITAAIFAFLCGRQVIEAYLQASGF